MTMNLYGIALAALPDKDDPDTLHISCNPISISQDNQDVFEVESDLSFKRKVTLTDINSVMQCLSDFLDTAERIVELQEENCRENGHEYRPVAFSFGDSAGNKVNANAVSLAIFGHPVSQYDTFDQYKNNPDSINPDYLDASAKLIYLEREYREHIHKFFSAPTTKESKERLDSQLKRLSELDPYPEIEPEDYNSKQAMLNKVVNMLHDAYDDFDSDEIRSEATEVDINDLSDNEKQRAIYYAACLEIILKDFPNSSNHQHSCVFKSGGELFKKADQNQRIINARSSYEDSDKASDLHQRLSDLLTKCSIRKNRFSGQYYRPRNINRLQSKLDLRILQLKTELEKNESRPDAHKELIQIAKQEGRRLGEDQNVIPDAFKHSEAGKGYEKSIAAQERFPQYSFFDWNPAYRDAFHEGFQEGYIGLYNKRLQLPLDPSRPPFTDPCAWRIRDQFDIVMGQRQPDKIEDRPDIRDLIIELAQKANKRPQPLKPDAPHDHYEM